MSILSFEQLREIVVHAYNNTSAFRTIMDEASISIDDIHSFADLDKIPVTTKDRLVELQQKAPPFGGFLAVPVEKLEHIFLSPGPLYEPSAGESAVLDTVQQMLSIADIGPGDVALNAFGYHLIPTGVALDRSLREAGATVIPAGVGNADLQIKMMKDLQVTAYIGTPSWLMALIDNAEKSGMDFNQEFSLRKALFSAEPLPPSLRRTFVEKYGLAVTNAYGTAELGFLAYNTQGGLAMQLLDTSVVQIANPESGQSVGPGEVGEVVVTTFNETYPLIRLGTGDLAMNVDPAPGQSSQAERAIILVGRVGDAVKVRGMFIHPNQLRFAVGQAPGVNRFQAVVERRDNRDFLLLQVAPADAQSDREALADALGQAIQASCRVKVDRIEFVGAGDLDEDSPLIVDQRSWE